MPNPFKFPYAITQYFGETKVDAEPAYTFNGVYYPNFHLGIDLVGPSATCPIYSITEGIVFACGTDRDGANYVIIESTGKYIAFWHLSKITVSREQPVNVGTQLGNQGSTGQSTANHLHLQVMLADHYGGHLNTTGIPTDPLPFIQDTSGGTPNDMQPEEIARGIRRITNPNNHVSDDVIHADAARIMAEGTIDGVLADNMNSVPWRDPSDADVYAIEAYAEADNILNPQDFARTKVQSGAGIRQVLSEVLSTLHGWLNDKDNQIATLNANISGQTTTIANDADTIKQLQDQLQQQAAPAPTPEIPPVVETPLPEPPPVEAPQDPPVEPAPLNPDPEPIAPVTPVEPPPVAPTVDPQPQPVVPAPQPAAPAPTKSLWQRLIAAISRACSTKG